MQSVDSFPLNSRQQGCDSYLSWSSSNTYIFLPKLQHSLPVLRSTNTSLLPRGPQWDHRENARSVAPNRPQKGYSFAVWDQKAACPVPHLEHGHRATSSFHLICVSTSDHEGTVLLIWGLWYILVSRWICEYGTRELWGSAVHFFPSTPPNAFCGWSSVVKGPEEDKARR